MPGLDAPGAESGRGRKLDDRLRDEIARILFDRRAALRELLWGSLAADHDPATAGLVDGLDDEPPEVGQYMAALLIVEQPERLDVRKDRVFAEVVADQARQV